MSTDEKPTCPGGESPSPILLLPEARSGQTAEEPPPALEEPVRSAMEAVGALSAKVITMPQPATLDTLAAALQVPVYDLVVALMRRRVFAQAETVFSRETVRMVCEAYGYTLADPG